MLFIGYFFLLLNLSLSLNFYYSNLLNLLETYFSWFTNTYYIKFNFWFIHKIFKLIWKRLQASLWLNHWFLCATINDHMLYQTLSQSNNRYNDSSNSYSTKTFSILKTLKNFSNLCNEFNNFSSLTLRWISLHQIY